MSQGKVYDSGKDEVNVLLVDSTPKEPGYEEQFKSWYCSNFSLSTRAKIYTGASMLTLAGFAVYKSYEFYSMYSAANPSAEPSITNNSSLNFSKNELSNSANTTAVGKRSIEQQTGVGTINVNGASYDTYTIPSGCAVDKGTVVVPGDTHLTTQISVNIIGPQLTDYARTECFSVTAIKPENGAAWGGPNDSEAIYRATDTSILSHNTPHREVQFVAFNNAASPTIKAVCETGNTVKNPNRNHVANAYIIEPVVPGGKLVPAACDLGSTNVNLAVSNKSKVVPPNIYNGYVSEVTAASGIPATNKGVKVDYASLKYTETNYTGTKNTVVSDVTHEAADGSNSNIPGGRSYPQISGYNTPSTPPDQPPMWRRIIEGIKASVPKPIPSPTPSPADKPEENPQLNGSWNRTSMPNITLPGGDGNTTTFSAPPSNNPPTVPAWGWGIISAGVLAIGGVIALAFVRKKSDDTLENTDLTGIEMGKAGVRDGDESAAEAPDIAPDGRAASVSGSDNALDDSSYSFSKAEEAKRIPKSTDRGFLRT